MKGFLAWHDEPFRKTHNLVEVGEQCAAIDATSTDLMRRAARMTESDWEFCYPGEPAEPSVAEAQEALALAREV